MLWLLNLNHDFKPRRFFDCKSMYSPKTDSFVSKTPHYNGKKVKLRKSFKYFFK